VVLRNAFACGTVIAVALAGCGGSGHKASTTRSSSAAVSTTTRASTTAAPSGIAGGVLTKNELPGFATGSTTVYRSPSAWKNAGFPAPSGFVVGASEQLNGPGGSGGVSVIAQYRSARAARAMLAAEVQDFKANDATSYAPFPVTGIPGALGLGEKGSPAGINVAFASGDYIYLVGEAPPSVTARAEHALDVLAQHVYQRLKR
jgi:hypothetical protein